jgi:hypothetical protein
MRQSRKTLLRHRLDLVIICKTVPDDVAQDLAAQLFARRPDAKIMSISSGKEGTCVGSILHTLNLAQRQWLPNAAASILPAEGY